MQSAAPETSGRKFLVSVHIPKTAGTSLIAEIKRGVLGRYLLDNDDRPTSTRLQHRLRRLSSRVAIRMYPRQVLQRYDVIHGHFMVGKYAFLYPQAEFITFLREPVPRLLSHYYYFRDVASKNPVTVSRNPDIALVANGSLGLVDFARKEAIRYLYERFLGGLALEHFAFVGLTERYAESIGLLNRQLGTTLEVRHERRADYSRYAEEYGPHMAELTRLSRENQRIYAAAVDLFEKRLRVA